MSNLDAIGAWPPKRDSHVEMDGAWALYEAWLRLQEGDIDIAVVTGSGRSSTGDPALIYPMEMDPYYLAPLGADPLTFAALQARAVIAAGIADERSMAEVAVRSRHDAIGNPTPRCKATATSTRCSPTDYVREPLRRHDLPPDHRRRRRDGAGHRRPSPRARRAARRSSPASTTARSATTPSFRDLADSPSTRIAAAAAGLGDGSGRGRRAAGRVHPRGAAAAPGARPRSTTWRSTASGGALASNPIMATGLARIGYAADHVFGGGDRGARPLDRRARACNRT